MKIPCVQMDMISFVAMIMAIMAASGIMFVIIDYLITRFGNKPMRTLYFPTWQAGLVLLSEFILIVLVVGYPVLVEHGITDFRLEFLKECIQYGY